MKCLDGDVISKCGAYSVGTLLAVSNHVKLGTFATAADLVLRVADV
jgi:hypothetical protein